MNLLSLLVQQRLEGGYELQVWRRRDIVVTLELVEEADTEVARGRVEHFTHGDAALAHLFFHLYFLQKPRRHRRQSVFRPRLQTRQTIGVTWHQFMR